jgi:hypothetical protein
MVLAGNVGLIFLIRIKLVGNNHGRHGGGSIWMFVMEGYVVEEMKVDLGEEI